MPLLRPLNSIHHVLHQSRVLLHHLCHVGHSRLEHTVRQVEHHRGPTDHHNQLDLRRHLDLRLVLVIQLLKHAIVIIDILHHVLGPPVQLQIKGVKLVIQKLQACDTGDEHTTLKLDGPVHLDTIHHTLKLCAHLLDVAVNRQAGAGRNTLLRQAANLVQQISLLVLDRLVPLTWDLRTTTPRLELLLAAPALVVLALLATVKLLWGWYWRCRPLPRVHEHVQTLIEL